ncbi:hypothetical protein [Hyalangium rubrum]|uniref:Lipoprotein n=1 Tax=Hyalangium rubrum TaxID=3103134 RepID=A0ABU5HBH1_9BACT|nr:hypothetical protein [Hyalangium sp. s54d21]MDY7230809.1 hypothetical protein [Hyalangium sp. s54d21]
MKLGWVVLGAWMLGCATTSPQPQSTSTSTPQSTSTASSNLAANKGAVASNKADPDKTLVCEDKAITGTRIPKKICRTQRQVEQEREAAQKQVREGDRINREMGN